MTCGPFTISSPGSPTGISTSPVSTSTILESVLGTGTPILPSRPSPAKVGLKCVTGEASESPYPSKMGLPTWASNERLRGTGNAEPPEL